VLHESSERGTSTEDDFNLRRNYTVLLVLNMAKISIHDTPNSDLSMQSNGASQNLSDAEMTLIKGGRLSGIQDSTSINQLAIWCMNG
jgi:hypothetical protein